MNRLILAIIGYPAISMLIVYMALLSNWLGITLEIILGACLLKFDNYLKDEVSEHE